MYLAWEIKRTIVVMLTMGGAKGYRDLVGCRYYGGDDEFSNGVVKDSVVAVEGRYQDSPNELWQSG